MNRHHLISFYVVVSLLLPHQAASQNTDYYARGNAYFLAAKNDSALICLDKALVNPADTVNYKRTAEILLLRSRILGTLTFFERAMKDAIQSYDICQKHNLGNLTAASLLSIGKVHYLMYNDSVAENYMLRAKALAEKGYYKKELVVIDNNLAQLYSVMEKNEECLRLANQSLKMAKEQKDTTYIIQNLTLFAAYYINLNRWTKDIIPEHQQKAKKYLDEASSLAERQNITMIINNVYANYVRYYRVDKNYPEALKYAEKVIERCKSTNDYSMMLQMYDHLVGIYAHLGDKDMVINSHQQFHELMRRQSDYRLHQSLQDMRVKYKTQEKENQLLLNKQRLKTGRLFHWLFTVAILLLIAFAGYLLYSIKIRKKQNHRLAEANAAKDKLFSIISHDLKSPAMAQKVAIDAIIEHAEKYDTKTLGLLNSFSNAAESQLSLLQNLMNWAMIQTGKMKYTPTTFDLCETIEKSKELYAVSAQNKNVALSIDTPENCMIYADRQMISTVVRNLLNNAVKFSNPGGTVKITSTQENAHIKISISDNGVGMNPQQINDLLNYNKNTSTNDTNGEKGSGLGLIICKELLEKNNSQLLIESRENNGTTFSFNLPSV